AKHFVGICLSQGRVKPSSVQHLRLPYDPI
ncbi:hypothetical protein CCACVL1_14489, partial [Corchorus capsularis]